MFSIIQLDIASVGSGSGAKFPVPPEKVRIWQKSPDTNGSGSVTLSPAEWWSEYFDADPVDHPLNMILDRLVDL